MCEVNKSAFHEVTAPSAVVFRRLMMFVPGIEHLLDVGSVLALFWPCDNTYLRRFNTESIQIFESFRVRKN